MTFVLDRGRYVNTANAVTGDIVTTTRGVRAVVLKDRAGNEVAVVSEDALNPPDVTIAGPLAAAFIAPDGSVEWRAVAAWRVSRTTNGAEPVIAGGPALGVMFVEFANGELLGMGRRFPDLKTATQAVREAAEEKELVQ
jgi:hypothetical protein